MIDVLAGFALDPTVPISMRRDCAKDVLAEAYGRPGERLSAPAQVAPGSPEAQETERAIDAIQRTSKQLEQLQAFVGAGVPYEQWPDEIKAIAGEFGAVWAEGTPEQEGQVGHAD